MKFVITGLLCIGKFYFTLQSPLMKTTVAVKEAKKYIYSLSQNSQRQSTLHGLFRTPLYTLGARGFFFLIANCER